MLLYNYDFQFDPEKDKWLSENRYVCFSDILPLLKARKWLAMIENPAQGRPDQSLFILAYEDECYAVPVVLDHKKKTVFLKTLFPSRKYRKIYMKKGKPS